MFVVKFFNVHLSISGDAAKLQTFKGSTWKHVASTSELRMLSVGDLIAWGTTASMQGSVASGVFTRNCLCQMTVVGATLHSEIVTKKSPK